MTVQEKNIQILKDMFSNFKKGDTKSLLNYVADDCDWWSPVSNSAKDTIPWATPRHGREEVSSLFSEVFAQVKPLEINPSHYTAQNDYCIVEGSCRGLALATGCEFQINWVMVYTMKNGKITRFRNYYDSADLSKALSGACEIRKAA